MVDELIVRTMLMHDDAFAIKCLLILYEKQEAHEQDTSTTLETNEVGFNKADALLLSELVRYHKNFGRFPAQGFGNPLETLHKRLPKYAKQLSQYLTEEDLI